MSTVYRRGRTRVYDGQSAGKLTVKGEDIEHGSDRGRDGRTLTENAETAATMVRVAE
jgi:hypothetical protein